MSTITKERIANLLQFNSEGSDCQANAEQWEVHELARIALASIEAKPVAAAYVINGVIESDDFASYCGHPKFQDGTIELYAAPPAPAVPGEWKQWIADAVEYLEGGLEADGELEAEGSIEAKRLLSRRAALLQGSQPVSNRDEFPEIECDICGFKSTDPDGAHYCCEDNSND